jgi:hypothetical protein
MKLLIAAASNRADEALSKSFAPCMTMLQVKRQRGEAGTEFVATNRHAIQ